MIAQRTIQSKLGSVRIELDSPSGDKYEVGIAYRIIGPRTKKRGRALGVDGIQAMQLVMERIAAELRASPEFEAGGLNWLDMDDPGFPLPENIAILGWKPSSQA